MKQIVREELLDLGRAPQHEVRQSLRDLRRINALPGGTRTTVAGVANLLKDQHEATILDVGTGSGDVPQALQAYAERRGLQWRVIGLDYKAEHLRLARHLGGGIWLQGDAFRLPFGDNGVDVVTASLLPHHFRAPQVVQLFGEFERVARVGWFVNDLVRARPPLLLFRLLWPVFARSYLTRYDARASIFRAYTVRELQALVNQAGIPAQVQPAFAYRATIARRKNS